MGNGAFAIGPKPPRPSSTLAEVGGQRPAHGPLSKSEAETQIDCIGVATPSVIEKWRSVWPAKCCLVPKRVSIINEERSRFGESNRAGRQLPFAAATDSKAGDDLALVGFRTAEVNLQLLIC